MISCRLGRRGKVVLVINHIIKNYVMRAYGGLDVQIWRQEFDL